MNTAAADRLETQLTHIMHRLPRWEAKLVFDLMCDVGSEGHIGFLLRQALDQRLGISAEAHADCSCGGQTRACKLTGQPE